MSHSFFQKQWVEAQHAMEDMIEIEETAKPEKDRASFLQLLATMYIKYIQIVRKLEDAYDQIVQPQKRRVVRLALDSTIGRLLEIKNEMVMKEFSEYQYIDDVLSDLKFVPTDIDIPIPRYFTRERAKALKEREKVLASILAKLEAMKEKPVSEEEQMTTEDAIRMIQVHERYRQGFRRAQLMRDIRLDDERERKKAESGAPKLDSMQAAIHIQRIWKGFMMRKKAERERHEEMVFLGMEFPVEQAAKEDKKAAKELNPQQRAKRTEEARHITQDIHEQEYQQARITLKEKIQEVEGPDLKEKMQDQIRQWFIECRDLTGKFPDFPDEDDGGSAKIFQDKDPGELEKELAEKEEGKGKKSGGGKKSGKKDKKSGKKDKKSAKGKKGKEEEEDMKLPESKFIPQAKEAGSTFHNAWQTRDESWNFSQKHDAELIREELRMDVEAEVRTQVDELMREELRALKLAVDREKGKKGKKSGKKKKKGKKSGKKGKKGKKEKDLTPDSSPMKIRSVRPSFASRDSEQSLVGLSGAARYSVTPLFMRRPGLAKQKTLAIPDSDQAAKKMLEYSLKDRTPENLYEELVAAGIVKHVPKTHLTEFMGDFNYLGTTLRMVNIEPQPSLSDVRRLVAEYCILPLGSQGIHESAPLIKSVLLTGPPGVGKKMLVNAICSDVGANLFDLTATNLAGKYPGKDGLKMLMHMMSKVGRALQPSIFMIDDCERMFKKKIPKSDPTDPKRLKKELPKFLKTFKGDDRLLLIGLSGAPFEAENKPMFSLYQKIVIIPRPAYGERHIMWRYFITSSNGILGHSLDISSLAKVSDGYTPGQIKGAVQTVLTEKRLKRQSKKPLTAAEFLPPLSKSDPVYVEQENAFKGWFEKTPLGKKRAKAAAGDDDPKAKGKGKGAKGKGK